MTTNYVGDTLRFAGVMLAFNENGDREERDPTTLEFVITKPDDSTVAYVYGVDAELVRDDPARYHVDVIVDAAGSWKWEWALTGDDDPIATVTSGSFKVDPAWVTLTVHVIDDVDADVAAVATAVFHQESGFLAGTKETDADGLVKLTLPPGKYAVETARPQYITAKQSVDVTADMTLTVVAVPYEIAHPSPNRTRLWGNVYDGEGLPQQYAEVTVTSLSRGMYALGGTAIHANNVGVLNDRRVVRTDVYGAWEIDLLPGLMVRVAIPSIGYESTFRVPSADKSPFNIADARPDPSAMTLGIRSDRATPGSSLVR